MSSLLLEYIREETFMETCTSYFPNDTFEQIEAIWKIFPSPRQQRGTVKETISG